MQQLVKNQGSISLQAVLTPIEEAFFYDVPSGLEEVGQFLSKHEIKKESDLEKLSSDERNEWDKPKEVSYFHGFLPLLEDNDYKQAFFDKKMPIFEKIKQGQLYRTFTPVLLHGSVLHILFNMLWLYVLMKQIEVKIGVIRTLLLAIIIGITSNTAQYLMSGPFFVGVSGIIVGLATFTWSRIKKTPWEGYLLSKTVMFFLLIYVLALVLVGLGVFLFNLSSHKDITFGIANTAHVVGGVIGIVLGRLKLFRRK
jgi:GlpG protein